MQPKDLYDQVSIKASKLIISDYSTSFYWASKLFNKEVRRAIYSIYGFVRIADEIVDSFFGFPQEELLNDFEESVKKALKDKLSCNPILHSFQITVRQYSIPYEYINSFLRSMRDDLTKSSYTSQEDIESYIYGSAEVVGLMSLCVFCKGNQKEFARLKNQAIKLGSAFQKVNFLRDLNSDITTLNRSYFPEITNDKFSEDTKDQIIKGIEEDFRVAYSGIKELPKGSKLAVSIAYCYYLALLRKIKRKKIEQIKNERVRISNPYKFILMMTTITKYKLRMIG